MKTKEFNTLLGRKIKLLREINDLTQMDIARELGYNSTGMVSQIESGKRGMDNDKILRISKFFGIHPGLLFSGRDYSNEVFKTIFKLDDVLSKPKSKKYGELQAFVSNLSVKGEKK